MDMDVGCVTGVGFGAGIDVGSFTSITVIKLVGVSERVGDTIFRVVNAGIFNAYVTGVQLGC